MSIKGLIVVPMEEPHCREICEWRYEPPYDLHNWDPWDRMVADQAEFTDPAIRKAQYASLLDSCGEVVGFAQFFPLKGVTRLGLGLRPDWCGQGNGLDAVKAIVREAIRRKPGNVIDLEVMTWNVRAQKVYEKAGFRRTDEYERNTPTGMGAFYCMVYGDE